MTHPSPYSIKRHGTTLEKCEYEPVETPGCIQAHGVLLALRSSDLTILQVSENSRNWLGLSPEDLLTKNVAVAVGKSVAKKIRSALEEEKLDKAPLYLTTLKLGEQKNKRCLHVSLHTHAGLVFLELEDVAASDLEQPDGIRVEPDYYGLVRKTLTRFQEASSIKELSQAITEELRRITQLDRVMVYYFHADYSGEVVGESKREDQVSWLGWRYPAHDIPQPAREIFKKIWSRPVPDVRAELFEMVPLLNPETNEPLDMTYCSLRGASVMYTEYLDNMGVRAALTLPLKREGELWGLIACHHDTPKIMSYRMRAAAEFLARGASQQFRLVEERENLEYKKSLEAANYALIAKMALATEISAFTEGPVHLGAGLDCGGAAIFYQDCWHKVGQTPQTSEIAELGAWLLEQPESKEGSSNPIFVTDHLCEHYPAAKDLAQTASGVMAFCFSRNPLGLVFYFKPETLQTLAWAGNPHELPIVEGPHGPRLSPRKSFELWREVVSNRSMPWKRVEIEATQNLRGLIIDMLVSKVEQLNILRLRVAERTREVEASRARLQEVLDAATAVAIISTTPGGLITIFNRGAERMLGYTSEEIVGKQTPAIFHLESEIIARGRKLSEETGRPVQGLDVFQVKAEKGQHDELECTYVRKDGRHLTVKMIITASFDPSGAIVGFVGIISDVTESKKAVKKIEEQAALLDMAHDAILVRDLEGKVLFWNKGAERIYGWTGEEVVGRNVSELLFANPKTFEETLALTISRGEWRGELQHTTKDRREITVEAHWTLVRDKEGQPRSVLAINTDVTEKKHIEAQFMRAQRMESLGTLAGGIAHDLNNILAPIIMSIDLLKAMSENPETTNILETIEISAKRGAEIVRQVLSFARGLEGERIEVQLGHLMKELEKIITNTFPKDIRLRSAISNQTWAILGDPTQVRQILLNLCVNARDAMPNGGLLTVYGENCVIDEHYAAMNPNARAGRYVRIDVTDTGTGIPPGLLGKIFEPFFTTKELGKGTGLGLSTVMAIVKSHDGFVNVYSEPGKGTTFKVYLPAMETSPENLTKVEGMMHLPRANGQTVLVVDDEASILSITSRTLQAYGCQVLTATDGADAVAVYLEHKNKIAIVLTDMAMPIMDGPALIHALMRINPAVNIIAASGLDANGSVADASRAGVKYILTKPYTAETLLQAVGQILSTG